MSRAAAGFHRELTIDTRSMNLKHLSAIIPPVRAKVAVVARVGARQWGRKSVMDMESKGGAAPRSGLTSSPQGRGSGARQRRVRGLRSDR